MYFEDGFNYSESQVNHLVKWAFLNYIKQVFKKRKNTASATVKSVKLIEHALKKLKISTFDFLNDNSIEVVQNGLKHGLDFLLDSKQLTENVNEDENYHRYFITKELFKTREFSNDFEQDLVITLIYRLNFKWSYKADPEFLEFYYTYLVNSVVESSTKIINVNLPKYREIKVLILSRKVSHKYLRLALSTYKLSDVDYVINYDKTQYLSTLYPVDELNENKILTAKLTLFFNVDQGVRGELKDSIF